MADAGRIEDEMRAKLPDLFKAHGITDGDWPNLAMALAKAHVPGFRVSSPPGRPNEWDELEAAEFKIEVDNICRAQGLSVVESIKLAIRLDAWAPKAADMTLGSLEKRYYEARNSKWVELVKKARAYEQIGAED